jgi:hypothetical protein
MHIGQRLRTHRGRLPWLGRAALWNRLEQSLEPSTELGVARCFVGQETHEIAKQRN